MTMVVTMVVMMMMLMTMVMMMRMTTIIFIHLYFTMIGAWIQVVLMKNNWDLTPHSYISVSVHCI